MKIVLAAALVLGACKAAKPPVPEGGAPPAPAAEAPIDQNRAEKYVSGLQADVKRAQEAKEKADAANKKAAEAEKVQE